MRKWAIRLFSDEALLKAYTSGETFAFECLYLRHKNAVFRFLLRQCNDISVCEELAHDAWLAVISRAHSYQPNASFKTWIFRIAHNRLVDHWRKHGRSHQQLLDEIRQQWPVSADPSTQGLELRELLSSLDVLSGEQLEALLLKIEGFTYAEIADITDAKRETVKSRLRYATQRMRLAMEATS